MLILHSLNQYDGFTSKSRPFPILAYLPSGDPHARLAIGGNNGSTCLWENDPTGADVLPLVSLVASSPVQIRDCQEMAARLQHRPRRNRATSAATVLAGTVAASRARGQ